MNNSEYRSVITIVLLSTLLILLILCFIGLIFYGAWQGGWFGIFAVLAANAGGSLSKR